INFLNKYMYLHFILMLSHVNAGHLEIAMHSCEKKTINWMKGYWDMHILNLLEVYANGPESDYLFHVPQKELYFIAVIRAKKMRSCTAFLNGIVRIHTAITICKNLLLLPEKIRILLSQAFSHTFASRSDLFIMWLVKIKVVWHYKSIYHLFVYQILIA
ncbi:hypothetical protein ACJX0J_037975, partial [Zea mays]